MLLRGITACPATGAVTVSAGYMRGSYASATCKTTRKGLPLRTATSWRLLHSGRPLSAQPGSKSENPDQVEKESVEHATGPLVSRDENVGRKRFADFDLAGAVFIVTGGAQGLGLALAEGLVEAGGKGESLPWQFF
jgi:hypothetical protein